ncbi:MAG: c-type cytochrome [Chloroflexi bacterium]|nr:c-type cytochrome [Chloroflexota bacterium]
MREKLKLLNFGLMLVLVVIILTACKSSDTVTPAPQAATTVVAQVVTVTVVVTAPASAVSTTAAVTSAPAVSTTAAAVSTTVAVAPAATTAPPPPGDAESGAVLFKWSCSRCHPKGGTVEGPGPIKQPILAVDRIMSNPTLIRNRIRNGPGGAPTLFEPAFSTNELRDGEVNDIVAFLTSSRPANYAAPVSTAIPLEPSVVPTNTPVPTVIVPNDAAGNTLAGDQLRGDVIFRRACQVCHANGGRSLGVNGQPNLSIDVDTWKPPFIRNFVTNGSPAGMPAWGKLGVLSPQEIEDLVAYVSTLNTSSERMQAEALDAVATPAPTTKP